MESDSRYLRERDEFISRARRLVPWLTPARLTFLAYHADTDHFGETEDRQPISMFGDVRMVRLPELRELGALIRFKTEPPWMEKRIPKGDRSGERLLYLPNVPLKQLHRFVLRAHLHRLEPDRAAYGFEPGRGRRDHAAKHCNQYVVVRVDLRRFFPSIGVERVEPIFEECGFHSRFRNVLAHLVTYHQRVPQGAPTSPKIADLVARPLDRKLRHLAKERRWTYSRYADDLSLSCGRELSSDAIGEMIDAAEEVVESEGFELNHTKTRVMKHHNRQLVAGAVVNNPSPTVPREKRRRVRAILHNCRKSGLVHEARRYHRRIKDDYGRPEVKRGRYPGEVKRSDRPWPYQKQVPFVPDRYNDPLVTYSPDEWPRVYDFWHYLSGLVGEINALDPARGRQLQQELKELKLGHTDVSPDLDQDQQRIRKFWDRASSLVAQINDKARRFAGTSRLIDFPPVDPEARVRVARSHGELMAFVGDVYRQLVDSLSREERRGVLYSRFEEDEFPDLEFAVALRHDHFHASEPGSERERDRVEVIEAGYERHVEGSRPEDAEGWMELQRKLCSGILSDLEDLRDWAASHGSD